MIYDIKEYLKYNKWLIFNYIYFVNTG